MVVTDHYAAYNFASFPGDWDTKVDAYLAGYRAAKAAGEPLGLTGSPGAGAAAGRGGKDRGAGPGRPAGFHQRIPGLRRDRGAAPALPRAVYPG